MTEDPALVDSRDILSMSLLRRLRQAEDQGVSDIQRAFDGSVVFITGGTGFLGKQLVEKLLRSCRRLKKIILLTRSKQGKSKEERFKVVLEDPVFDEIRKIEPDFEKRISLVDGDITELKVGLNDDDWMKLTEEVNFIFHEAATVRFNEPLKVAVLTNVRGTRELIYLARECKNLRSFVYVSTAYSNCYRDNTTEMFYEPAAPPDALIDMMEKLDDHRIDEITPGLIRGYPNTYTYSKQVSESLVKQMADGSLPLCVVRPGIVVPSYCEPSPGWLDISNCYGPSGLALGGTIGLIRSIYVNEDVKLDLVPVDLVNNMTIAACWYTAERWAKNETDVKIYQVSASRKMYTWKQAREYGRPVATKHLTPKTVGPQWSLQTSNIYIYSISYVFLHLIPGFFIDLILKALGQKIRVSRIYKKAFKVNRLLSYFLTKNFYFNDNNAVQLMSKLSDLDRIIYPCDLAKIDMSSHMSSWWFGLRKYIIKDGLKGTDVARRRMPYFIALSSIIIPIYVFLLWKTFSFTITMLTVIVSCLIGFVCPFMCS